MEELQLQEEPKPQLEQALASDLPHPLCPLVVVDAGTKRAMTFVVLEDQPDTLVDQTEQAQPNFQQPVRVARKLLQLEADPDCQSELIGMIGRSEGRVAIAVPGELRMSAQLLQKLGRVTLE